MFISFGINQWTHGKPPFAMQHPPLQLFASLIVYVHFLQQPSLSLPGTPFVRRNTKKKYNPIHGDHQPLMLDNLPYIDDPNAVTPCSDDLNMNLTYKQFIASRRGSYASLLKRTGSSRRSSFASRDSRRSLPKSPRSPLEKPGKLDTPWDWKKPKDSSLLHPLDAGDRGKHTENVSLQRLLKILVFVHTLRPLRYCGWCNLFAPSHYFLKLDLSF